MRKIGAFLVAGLIPLCALADECIWESSKTNGVYAYAWTHATDSDGRPLANSKYRLFLGTYIGEVSSTSESISYNGKEYYVGPFVDTVCLGRECAKMSEDYQVCSKPASNEPAPTTPTEPASPSPSYGSDVSRVELCDEGYTGRIQYKWETYYTYETYYYTDNDGNTQSSTTAIPHKREVLDFNSCKIIPTQNTSSQMATQELTCDDYYGTTSGTYYGSVYKYGTYISTYDENAKQTNTTWSLSSIDTTSCTAQLADMVRETDTETCPNGENGSNSKYRVKGVNTNGEIVFPYGSEWQVSNNSCAAVQADTPSVTVLSTPQGLLSNLLVTTSNLQSKDEMLGYLNALNSAEWSTNDDHKLTINVDDLSAGKYSAEKVGQVVSKFREVVVGNGAHIQINLPSSIDRFVGVTGDITEASINSGKVFIKSIVLDDKYALLSYYKTGENVLAAPKLQEARVLIIPENVSLSGVSIN